MGPPDPRASTLAHLSCSHIHLVDVGLKGCAMRLHPARVQPSFFLAHSPKRKKDGDEPSKKKRWWVDALFPKHAHFHTEVPNGPVARPGPKHAQKNGTYKETTETKKHKFNIILQ